MIAELNLDKQTTLSLQMDIEGNPDTGDVAVLRFYIDLGEFSIVVNGEKTTDNVYEITFPKMKGIAAVGTYNATVDVFIGDKRFEAMADTVTIKQDVKPVVKAAKKDGEKTVSVKAAVVAQAKAKESVKETTAKVVNTTEKEKESVKESVTEDVSPLRAFIEKTGRTVSK